ncbi:MAG TPA: DUF547 domain-containing protein [Vicinamibacterales bacterium]
MRFRRHTSRRWPAVAGLLAVATALVSWSQPGIAAEPFDHEYTGYGRLLAAYVRDGRVDYRSLAAERAALSAVARAFGEVAPDSEKAWTLDQRLAFWINTYNFFTLRAVLDHYPIRGGWLSLYPRNSIRQIDGVWSKLTWRVAGRDLTLDDIEHRILRPVYREPRIHFAINCASLGCPPLRSSAYLAAQLEAQLDEAARTYLGSPQGAAVEHSTLAVTSILKWYGADFVDRFARLGPAGRDAKESAIVAVITTYGPARASALARTPGVKIRFLDYDWSLNDVAR